MKKYLKSIQDITKVGANNFPDKALLKFICRTNANGITLFILSFLLALIAYTVSESFYLGNTSTPHTLLLLCGALPFVYFHPKEKWKKHKVAPTFY